MILQALTKHYEDLVAKGVLSAPGFGYAKINFALEIDEEGNLVSVQTLGSPDEKGRMIPQRMLLPSPVKRASNTLPNFLWDNSSYILGFDGKGKPERSKECFEAARKLHSELLGKSEDPFAKAVTAFFGKWIPGDSEHPAVAAKKEELSGAVNITFTFGSRFPSESEEMKRIWQKHYDGANESAEETRCLVTGEKVIPEATHPSVMKVRGAQSSGAALVSFNASAFCSFGKEQNLNAPVGKYAAFAYTAALNRLVDDREHNKLFGDTTVVYWADGGESVYQDFFGMSLDGSDEVTDKDLDEIMKKLSEGKPCDWDSIPLDPRNRFYVLGLAPNAARLSVRFFIADGFGELIGDIRKHYDRLRIIRPKTDKTVNPPMWRLLSETVNKNSKDKKPSPQLAGDMLRAVLTGGDYPATLYQGVMMRIKAEKDISPDKAAIIKAYLLQKEYKKEVLTVELNENTNYLPYLLGRLFSVLENLQSAANPGINTTIKDKYFTSAGATPSVVFPTLVNLAQKHLRKLEGGQKVFFSKKIGELTSRITESYPKHLSLYDQGIFQLGYYHETQKRYESRKDNKEEN